MANSDIILTIGRIERALSRIEMALKNRAEEKPEDSLFASSVNEEDYQKLRNAAENAVAQIDALLKEEEVN